MAELVCGAKNALIDLVAKGTGLDMDGFGLDVKCDPRYEECDDIRGDSEKSRVKLYKVNNGATVLAFFDSLKTNKKDVRERMNALAEDGSQFVETVEVKCRANDDCVVKIQVICVGLGMSKILPVDQSFATSVREYAAAALSCNSTESKP